MTFRLSSMLLLLASLAGGCSGDDSATSTTASPEPAATTTPERGDHALGGYTRAYDRGTGMGEEMQNAVDQQNAAMEEQLR